MFVSLSCYGQHSVYVVHDKSKANKIVYRTKYFSECHLAVTRVEDITKSNLHHWFFVTSELRADWIVYYTTKREEADYCVYFTNNPKLLGSYTPVKTPNTYNVKKHRYE